MSPCPLLPLLHCHSAVIEEAFALGLIPGADGVKRPMDAYIPREEDDFLYSIVRHRDRQRHRPHPQADRSAGDQPPRQLAREGRR